MKYVIPGEVSGSPQYRFSAFEELRLEVILKASMITPKTLSKAEQTYQPWKWVFRVGDYALIHDLFKAAESSQAGKGNTLILASLETVIARSDSGKRDRFYNALRQHQRLKGLSLPLSFRQHGGLPGSQPRLFRSFLEYERQATIQVKPSARLISFDLEPGTFGELSHQQLNGLAEQVKISCSLLTGAVNHLHSSGIWTPLGEYRREHSRAAVARREQEQLEQALTKASQSLEPNDCLTSAWLI